MNMKEQIKQLILENERKGDFTYSVASDSMIKMAEEKLGLMIPEGYRWFLKQYGYGGIGGIEILGISKNNKAVFIDETLRYREYGLPKELIAIENCDEWIYCINSKDGTIVEWSPVDGVSDVRYKDFYEYFLDRLNDIIENI